MEQLNALEAAEFAASFEVEKLLADPERRSAVDKATWLLRLGGTRLPATQAHRSLISWLLSLGQDSGEQIDQVCYRLAIDPTNYLHRYSPYMTEKQIKQLADDGFIVGSHSTNHRQF